MIMIPLTHGLTLAACIFVIGLFGLLRRRNPLFILMSLEIMLNAAALAFVLAGSYWQQADGQVMFIMILTLAAAEVGLALAFLLQLKRKKAPLDIDKLSEMGG